MKCSLLFSVSLAVSEAQFFGQTKDDGISNAFPDRLHTEVEAKQHGIYILNNASVH